MSNIDKRAQMELYAKVEQQAHKLRGNPIAYQVVTGMCPVNVIEMHAQKVQALLDELEAKDKSIDFLKDQLAKLANFNPDWDKLEAATDSLREHIAKLSSAEKRIAELSASHGKLREAIAGIHNTITAGGAYTPLAAILNASKRAYEESAAAAGKGE